MDLVLDFNGINLGLNRFESPKSILLIVYAICYSKNFVWSLSVRAMGFVFFLPLITNFWLFESDSYGAAFLSYFKNRISASLPVILFLTSGLQLLSALFNFFAIFALAILGRKSLFFPWYIPEGLSLAYFKNVL